MVIIFLIVIVIFIAVVAVIVVKWLLLWLYRLKDEYFTINFHMVQKLPFWGEMHLEIQDKQISNWIVEKSLVWKLSNCFAFQ